MYIIHIFRGRKGQSRKSTLTKIDDLMGWDEFGRGMGWDECGCDMKYGMWDGIHDGVDDIYKIE